MPDWRAPGPASARRREAEWHRHSADEDAASRSARRRQAGAANLEADLLKSERPRGGWSRSQRESSLA